MTVIVLWIHLMAAIAFIGGTLFYFVAYRPVLTGVDRGAGRRLEQGDFTAKIEQRFRTIRWLSLVALLITGFFNLLYEGASPRLESAYGGVLMLKLLLVLILVALTAIHDFVVGPQGRNRLQPAARAGSTQEAATRGTPWLGLTILGLSLVIVLVAVILSRK